MYIPKHFEETDVGVLHSLIESHPLGAWVTQSTGGLVANHIPFLIHRDRGPLGTLTGHVARANPAWQTYSRTLPSLIIFQGPEAYITPSWYPSKAEHGKVVPTWNYAVVHAHGLPAIFEDKDWLLAHVSELTNSHESQETAPWKVTDAPAEFIERMLGSIVGIEIAIDRIEGKWKAGQNRGAPDRLGAVAGLRRRGRGESSEVAAIMERYAKTKR
jgi:transcriptional regulator